MKIRNTLFLLFLVCQTTLFAQNSNKDTSLFHKGFDFLIAGGTYLGNKYTASYYNGSPENENNLNYIFGNKYHYDQINELVKSKYNYVGDSIFLYNEDLPGNMRYKVAMAIALGLKYKFNKNWGISLNYTFARLTASDVFMLRYKGENGNIRNDYISQYLVGKENRSLFDLSVSYVYHPSKVVKPFFDFGLQFTYVKVHKFFALIEEQEFDLLDYYNGVNYVPGVDRQKEDIIFGGAGYGLSASVGVKLAFNQYISIDPAFYISASSFALTGYKAINLNYGFFIRVIMSDLLFLK